MNELGIEVWIICLIRKNPCCCGGSIRDNPCGGDFMIDSYVTKRARDVSARLGAVEQ
jgi:hypothetical protein